MNAPHPLLHRRTGNPVDDAMRHDDDRQADQDLHEAMLAEAEQQAPLIVLAQLQALKQPGDWFNSSICTGTLWSPDEIFGDAINADEDCLNAWAELAISPAAQRLRQAMAEWFGRKHAMAIYLERAATC